MIKISLGFELNIISMKNFSIIFATLLYFSSAISAPEKPSLKARSCRKLAEFFAKMGQDKPSTNPSKKRSLFNTTNEYSDSYSSMYDDEDDFDEDDNFGSLSSSSSLSKNPQDTPVLKDLLINEMKTGDAQSDEAIESLHKNKKSEFSRIFNSSYREVENELKYDKKRKEIEPVLNNDLLNQGRYFIASCKSLNNDSTEEAVGKFLKSIKEDPRLACSKIVVKNYNEAKEKTRYTLEDQQLEASNIFVNNLKNHGEAFAIVTDPKDRIEIKTMNETIKDLKIFDGGRKNTAFCLSNLLKKDMPLAGSNVYLDLLLLQPTHNKSLIRSRQAIISALLNSPSFEKLDQLFRQARNYESDFLHFTKQDKTPSYSSYFDSDDDSDKKKGREISLIDEKAAKYFYIKNAERSSLFNKDWKQSFTIASICINLLEAVLNVSQGIPVERTKFIKILKDSLNFRVLLEENSSNNLLHKNFLQAFYRHKAVLTMLPVVIVGKEALHSSIETIFQALEIFGIMERIPFISKIVGVFSESQSTSEIKKGYKILAELSRELWRGNISGINNSLETFLKAHVDSLLDSEAKKLRMYITPFKILGDGLRAGANSKSSVKENFNLFREAKLAYSWKATKGVYNLFLGSKHSIFSMIVNAQMHIAKAVELTTSIAQNGLFDTVKQEFVIDPLQNMPMGALAKLLFSDLKKCKTQLINGHTTLTKTLIPAFETSYKKLIGCKKFLHAVMLIAQEIDAMPEVKQNLRFATGLNHIKLLLEDTEKADKVINGNIIQLIKYADSCQIRLNKMANKALTENGLKQHLKIKEKVEKISAIKSKLESNKAEIFELQGLLKNLLKEETFNRAPTFFKRIKTPKDLCHIGQVTDTFKKMIEQHKSFGVMYQGLAEVGTYFGLAKMIKASLNSTTNAFCLVSLDEEDVNINLKNVWNPLAYGFNEETFDKFDIIPSSIELGNQPGKPQHILLTGRNADGKSTFLRSIAYAAWMTMTVGIACAKEAHMPIIRYIFSLEKQAEDPAEKLSSHAGQSKLFAQMTKDVAQVIKSGHAALLFCDELFSGTNTYDALAGIMTILELTSNSDNKTHYLGSTHQFFPSATKLISQASHGKCSLCQINEHKQFAPEPKDITDIVNSRTQELLLKFNASKNVIDLYEKHRKSIDSLNK